MYTVKCDGEYIYEYRRGFILVNPVLTMADSAAGSFEFTITPDHPMYTRINQITSTITVFRDGSEIWSGRPVEETTDFYKRKTIYCEGELAFLNDSIQPQAEYHAQSVRAWLTTLLSNHNAQVAADKRFQVGAVTIEENLYRYTNYENTLYCLNDKLISRLGGHLRIRKHNGIRYLDYLKDYPKRSVQEIKFGRNLLDYSSNYTVNDIATAIIPLGARLDESSIDALDAYLDVKSVNGGSVYVRNEEAIKNFGWICKVIRWDDVTTAGELLRKAKAYLSKIQYDEMSLQIRAVDFHLVESSQPALDLLDEVHVISKPHGMDTWMPVTEQRITLSDPGDTTYTLGNKVNISLTAKSNSAVQALKDAIENIVPASSVLKQAQENATQLIISGALGSHVVVKPDEIYVMDTDNPDTAKKVWRWNVNGLGYSSKGINGPYGLAMTMDGRIVADYVTTGTMQADRIRGGTLALGGGAYGESLVKMYDGSNNLIGQWDKSGLNTTSLTARKYISVVGGNSNSIIQIPISSNESDGYTSLSKDGLEVNYKMGSGRDYYHVGYMKNDSRSVIDVGFAYTNGDTYAGSSKVARFGGTSLPLSVHGSGGSTKFQIAWDGFMYAAGNVNIQGGLVVSGTKSRVTETTDYGNRTLYCYETSSPLFGDVGEGTISEDGKCYVWIDSIFAETVSLKQYQIFIQKYGDGDCYVSERKPGYFIVEGTPGLSFGWELKAKQSDFDQLRLDRYTNTDATPTRDYGAEAANYISELKKGKVVE